MKAFAVTLGTLFPFLIPVSLGAEISLVEDGRSEFVIYHDSSAPMSIVMAASDLQKYVQEVSGARLEIVQDSASPMICLGENAASRSAGFSAETIPVEGFRIAVKESDIYILGPDTPEGELTREGGHSTGTRNGTYSFLERFLGVRWLMPGEHGDYVPKTADITIPETDLTDAPFFRNRRLPYTQERRPEVKRWWARQRLGWSLFLNHSHNWARSVPVSHFDEHPDWFAEFDGVRVPPTGRYKLCMTNPDLMRAYAEAAIAFFDSHPDAVCYSLSPSDSAGWCTCSRCREQYEDDPNGDLSVTPAVLNFYNGVADHVAAKHPDKLLAGYVYAAYVFPPGKPIKLEPNVFLVWAPSFDYGYTLFRPELRKQWETLVGQMDGVTRQIAYYDLPAKVSSEIGALNPPGLKILKFIYPRLKKAGHKGVYIYGVEAWGRGGPLNYLLARLAWNPDADVDALFEEYCDKAYGESAAEMKRLWRLLDDEFERHYIEHENARYRLTTDMMRDIYLKQWPTIEHLFRTAETKATTPDYRARLAMTAANLTVMHWNLRSLGLFKNPKASSFHLTDDEFFDFYAEHTGSLALHPPTGKSKPDRRLHKLAVSPATSIPNAGKLKQFRLRGTQHLVFYPTGKQAEVRFVNVSTRGELLTYEVYSAEGSKVTGGVARKGVPILLDPAGSGYYHLFVSCRFASFGVEVKQASWAVDTRLTDQGMHLLSKVAPLYLEIPDGLDAFHLTLRATPPGEAAIAALHRPDGSLAAEFDCTITPVVRKKVTGPPGWWKLDIRKGTTGAIDDVWVVPGKELGGFLSIDPNQALSVKPLK